MMIFPFFAILVFSLANGAWLLRRFQNVHHSVWIGLGQPTVTMSSGVSPRLALIRYIWALHFLKLNDFPLSVVCWAAISAELALGVLLLLFVLGVK
jgi:hypothetical protein